MNSTRELDRPSFSESRCVNRDTNCKTLAGYNLKFYDSVIAFSAEKCGAEQP